MVDFEHVRAADPDTYDELATSWARFATTLDHTDEDIKQTVGTLDDWHGEAAETAFTYFKDLRSDYADAVECLEQVPRVLRWLSDEVSSAQQSLAGVIQTVDGNDYLRMRPDGKVYLWEGLEDPSGPDVDVGDSLDKQQREQYQELADWLNGQVTQAVDDATDADHAADARLRKLTPTAAGLEREVTGSDATVAAGDIPDGDTTPSKVDKWWNGLNAAQQESVLHHHPDKIGALDGVPVVARDRANRATFTEDYNQVKTQVAEYQELGDQRTEEQQERYDKLKGKLTGMNAINKRLEDDSGGKHAYLMDFSPKGNGRAAVAAGNPDTADNVATSVPGTYADLDGIDKHLKHSEKLLDEATRRGSRGEEHAAVTWLGYDAPQSLPSAATDGYAEDAAGDLQKFQDGLRATHEGAASNNTLIGHSYGTTAIGEAAQHADTQLEADNVVLLGSPGIDAMSTHDLQLPDNADVYASTAKHDTIRITPPGIHGPQPKDMLSGVETFDSDPGPSGTFYYSNDAHLKYWEPGSDSLKNMGRIAVGKGTQ